MKDFGIRNIETGEIIARFDDPIEAKANLPETGKFEIVEREPENEYQIFPDGKSYIVGIIEKWKEYIP